MWRPSHDGVAEHGPTGAPLGAEGRYAARLALVKRLHPAVAALGAVGASVALSACSFFSPVQTEKAYNAADGVPVTSGPVAARDLLVVAERAGGPGTLAGSLLNTTDDASKVGFLTRAEAEAGGAATMAPLPGRAQQNIKGVQFAKIPSAPGTMTDIYLVTPAGRTMVSVPVLLPDGPYATLKPTAAASAATTP